MKKLILILIVLAVGIAAGIYFQKQPKSQELETRARTDAEQVGADVKTDAQKAGEVAADAKADLKLGVEKSKEAATNVADTVKAGAQKVGEVTTNVLGEIKGKLP
jgi:uncharacterized protein HemX